MTDKEGVLGMSRRRYVQLLGGSAATVGIAGCSGNGDGGDSDGGGDDGGSDGDGGSDTTPTATAASGSTTLEIQHWWTSGGDGEAMQMLQDEFLERNPDYEISDNPVAGGAGQNLQAVIRQKVLEGDPPSTWQDWPGRNLADYVEAGALKDITDIFEGDMMDNYREGAMLSARAGNPDNPPVAVPLNIHRVNNLFWDVSALDGTDIDPSSASDPYEFNDILAQIDEQVDLAPLSVAQSAPWTNLQLWVSNFLGIHGAEAFRSFRAGEGDIDAIAEALEVTKEQFQYLTGDATSIGNDAAAAKLPQGDAVTAMEGDWMAGNLFATDGYEYSEGWEHAPWPGSDGIYVINTDGFPYPEPNPSPEVTDAWMRWVGSAEAQRMFNPMKGAIPPRADVDVSEFNELLRSQFEDYQNDTGVLTVTHGDGATPQQGTSLKNAMARFIEREDVDATAPALRDAMTL
jgi:glucose/mannose transport system substrate-binding protein